MSIGNCPGLLCKTISVAGSACASRPTRFPEPAADPARARSSGQGSACQAGAFPRPASLAALGLPAETYYKPNADYYGYRHHYVIYFPQRPDYYYFYNPYTKRYWGRCPVKHDGKAAYALLKESDRRETLADIPGSAFPKPGAMPAVPDSTDGESMDLPPDDLPQMEPGAK